MRICKNCGIELQDTDRVCAACGQAQSPILAMVEEARTSRKVAVAAEPARQTAKKAAPVGEFPTRSRRKNPAKVVALILVLFVLIAGWIFFLPQEEANKAQNPGVSDTAKDGPQMASNAEPSDEPRELIAQDEQEGSACYILTDTISVGKVEEGVAYHYELDTELVNGTKRLRAHLKLQYGEDGLWYYSYDDTHWSLVYTSDEQTNEVIIMDKLNELSENPPAIEVERPVEEDDVEEEAGATEEEEAAEEPAAESKEMRK